MRSVQEALNDLRRADSGVALILVLFAVAFLLAAGLAFLTLAGADRRLSSNELDTARAFNAAEAGVDWARAQLKGDPGYRTPSYGPVDLGGASFVVSVTGDSSQITLLSVGSAGKARRTVSATLRRQAHSMFSSAVQAGTNLTLPEETTIYGNVHVNGDVKLESKKKNKPTYIEGTLTYSGELEIEEPDYTTITGGASQAAAKEFPTEDVDWYRNQAAPEDRYTGDVEYPADSKNKTINFGNKLIFVDGDIKFKHNVTVYGKATLVATGEIEIKQDITYGDSSSLLVLIGFEGIKVDKNRSVNGVLYSPESIELEGHNEITGGVYAPEVDAETRLTITYDQRAFQTPTAGMPGTAWELESWQAP